MVFFSSFSCKQCFVFLKTIFKIYFIKYKSFSSVFYLFTTHMQKRQINLKHIESRPSKSNKKDYEFYVDIDTESADSESVKLVLEDLKSKTSSVVLHTEESGMSKIVLTKQRHHCWLFEVVNIEQQTFLTFATLMLETQQNQSLLPCTVLTCKILARL